jgi:hypothetical protein
MERVPQQWCLVPGSISMPNIDPHIPSWSREDDNSHISLIVPPSTLSSSSSRSPRGHRNQTWNMNRKEIWRCQPFAAARPERWPSPCCDRLTKVACGERAVESRRLVSGARVSRKRTKGSDERPARAHPREPRVSKRDVDPLGVSRCRNKKQRHSWVVGTSQSERVPRPNLCLAGVAILFRMG